MPAAAEVPAANRRKPPTAWPVIFRSDCRSQRLSVETNIGVQLGGEVVCQTPLRFGLPKGGQAGRGPRGLNGYNIRGYRKAARLAAGPGG